MQTVTQPMCKKREDQSCAQLPTGLRVAENERGGVEAISLLEAWQLMERQADDPNFVVLDLRHSADFADGHLKGAVNLEYDSPFGFEEKLSHLDRRNAYLIYCYGGGLSAEAALLMEEMGFDAVYDMAQGLNSWLAADCPMDIGFAA
jgi:rhodanese-related sulfurtransferase